MPYDVRSISNYVLDIAERERRVMSNLSINKVVYFMYCYYLLEFKESLVSAKIEAWDYGPVFRELYREFKVFGEKPILGRAHWINPESGKREICDYEISQRDRVFLEPVVSRYVKFSASNLVTLSHSSGGPWDKVWNHATGGHASMRISDEIILACHRAAARH